MLPNMRERIGVDIYMALHAYHLLKGLKTQTPRMKAAYISFSFIQLFLFTLLVATNGITEQFMWIDHRDFPGGPLAFFNSVGDSWYQVLNVSCGVVSLAMSDTLLVGHESLSFSKVSDILSIFCSCIVVTSSGTQTGASWPFPFSFSLVKLVSFRVQ